ncbi:MAG: undecaprenyl/decaprenyl-phosphate alpha-N-acetylglucosaminyl 1-phosphate transferase [Treponema sp.]|nr:undecaprenyl/decaprenyl-phosphate alpha-N-acetylglucosaminyl 1-phosphate transferase [Treponema sp.]
MIDILLLFLAVAVLSGGIVALLIRLAHSKSWYDRVSERRVHSGNVPRLGGLGFALVFLVAVSVVMFLLLESGDFVRFLPVLAGVCIIVFFGVWDDFRPLRPSVKLLVQTIAALCVVIPGYVFSHLVFFDGGVLARLPWLGHAVTVLWLVGMTNAINLIDGVDGLAGGVSVIAALTFAYIFSIYVGGFPSVMICVALAGSVVGFLAFNAPLPKAKIFMGDGGSQFLGFTLALLPLLKEHNTTVVMSVLCAAAILAIPILDTTAAVWRRVRDRQPLSSPDKLHVHHKLINLGLSVRKIDAIMFSLQAAVSILVIISLRLEGLWSSLAALGLACFLAVTFFVVIHFMNRRAL